jgi:hypothetical protein
MMMMMGSGRVKLVSAVTQKAGSKTTENGSPEDVTSARKIKRTDNRGKFTVRCGVALAYFDRVHTKRKNRRGDVADHVCGGYLAVRSKREVPRDKANARGKEERRERTTNNTRSLDVAAEYTLLFMRLVCITHIYALRCEGTVAADSLCSAFVSVSFFLSSTSRREGRATRDAISGCTESKHQKKR